MAMEAGAQLSKMIGSVLRSAGVDSGGAEPWAFGIVGFVFAATEWWLGRPTMSRAGLRGLPGAVRLGRAVLLRRRSRSTWSRCWPPCRRMVDAGRVGRLGQHRTPVGEGELVNVVDPAPPPLPDLDVAGRRVDVDPRPGGAGRGADRAARGTPTRRCRGIRKQAASLSRPRARPATARWSRDAAAVLLVRLARPGRRGRICGAGAGCAAGGERSRRPGPAPRPGSAGRSSSCTPAARPT